MLQCWRSSSSPCCLAWGEVVIQAPEPFTIGNMPSAGDCISRARTQHRFWMLKFWTEVSRVLWRARIEALLKNFSCILLHCSSNWVPWNFRECVFWTNISWVERVNEGTEVLLIPIANRGHRRSGQVKDEIYLWRQNTCKMLSSFTAAQAPFKSSVSRSKEGGGDISCQKTRGGTGLTTPVSCGTIWSETAEDEKVTSPQLQLSVLPPRIPLPGKQGHTRHPGTLGIWKKYLQAIVFPHSYTLESEAICSWLHHLVLDLAP